MQLTKRWLMEMAGLAINENAIQSGYQFEKTWEKAYNSVNSYEVGDKYVTDYSAILINLLGKLATASTSKIQQKVSGKKELVPAVCKSLFGNGSVKISADDIDSIAKGSITAPSMILSTMDHGWGRFEEAPYRQFCEALESGDAKTLKQYPSASKLFNEVGKEGEEELANTFREVFVAAMDIFNTSFPDYVKSEVKKMNFPKKPEETFKPSYSPTNATAKKALEAFKKNVSLKGDFEQWLVDELEGGDYGNREELISNFGPGMQEDDFDMDEIVYNIINKKKYQNNLGEFFSEFEATNGK
jgi:hypothetical protein